MTFCQSRFLCAHLIFFFFFVLLASPALAKVWPLDVWELRHTYQSVSRLIWGSRADKWGTDHQHSYGVYLKLRPRAPACAHVCVCVWERVRGSQTLSLRSFDTRVSLSWSGKICTVCFTTSLIGTGSSEAWYCHRLLITLCMHRCLCVCVWIYRDVKRVFELVANYLWMYSAAVQMHKNEGGSTVDNKVHNLST